MDEDWGDLVLDEDELIDITTGRIQSKLAEVCLKLGDFDDVCSWADRATDMGWRWYISGGKGRVSSHGRAYFCKAVALERTGAFFQAIEAMQKAVKCDQEDAASCCKLAGMEGRWCVK